MFNFQFSENFQPLKGFRMVGTNKNKETGENDVFCNREILGTRRNGQVFTFVADGGSLQINEKQLNDIQSTGENIADFNTFQIIFKIIKL